MGAFCPFDTTRSRAGLHHARGAGEKSKGLRRFLRNLERCRSADSDTSPGQNGIQEALPRHPRPARNKWEPCSAALRPLTYKRVGMAKTHHTPYFESFSISK